VISFEMGWGIPKPAFFSRARDLLQRQPPFIEFQTIERVVYGEILG